MQQTTEDAETALATVRDIEDIVAKGRTVLIRLTQERGQIKYRAAIIKTCCGQTVASADQPDLNEAIRQALASLPAD